MKPARDNILKAIEVLRRRLVEMDNKQYLEEVLPYALASVGKTFVYRNNTYGGDKKWDIFRKLLRVVEHKTSASLIYQECQIDSHGVPIATLHVHYLNGFKVALGGAGFEPCSEEEYNRALTATVNEGLLPTRTVEYLIREEKRHD